MKYIIGKTFSNLKKVLILFKLNNKTKISFFQSYNDEMEWLAYITNIDDTNILASVNMDSNAKLYQEKILYYMVPRDDCEMVLTPGGETLQGIYTFIYFDKNILEFESDDDAKLWFEMEYNL